MTDSSYVLPLILKQIQKQLSHKNVGKKQSYPLRHCSVSLPSKIYMRRPHRWPQSQCQLHYSEQTFKMEALRRSRHTSVCSCAVTETQTLQSSKSTRAVRCEGVWEKRAFSPVKVKLERGISLRVWLASRSRASAKYIPPTPTWLRRERIHQSLLYWGRPSLKITSSDN